MALNVGDPAPKFSGQTQSGETISLGDFAGKNVVLYFYPKDDTPGCTTQACALRDDLSQFKDKNAVVIGVSADSVESHRKFSDKFSLPFQLLADVDREAVEAYGVWVEKNMYGKKHMGIQRSTFVIGTDGTLKAIFPKVKPAEHVEAVLAVLD
jgi:peroxiredoxin Q/BCP